MDKDVLDKIYKEIGMFNYRKGCSGNDKEKKYINIKWQYLKFKEPIIIEGKGEYIGINIMPYRISYDDVKNAFKNDDLINIYPDVTDFDFKTGNFHKNIDYDFQIVLVKKCSNGQLGPGHPDRLKYDEKNRLTCESRERLKERNNDLYMPTLENPKDFNNDVVSMIKELLKKYNKIK